MNISRCEKGHFFDLDLYAKCPYCEGKAAPGGFASQYPRSRQDAGYERPACIYAGPPPVCESPGPVTGDELRQCERGHIYNGKTYASCPYCEGKITFAPLYPHSRQGAGDEPPVCIYAGPPSDEWSKPDTGRNKGTSKMTLLDRLKKWFR